MTAFGTSCRSLIRALCELPGAALSETPVICRVDSIRCSEEAVIAAVRATAEHARLESFGAVRVFGAISGEHDARTVTLEDIADEDVSVVIEKTSDEAWCFFLTLDGFAGSLDDQLAGNPKAIWVAEQFSPFTTMTMGVSPWDGSRTPPQPDETPEKPRKLVRDLTHGRTPADIRPWILVDEPRSESPVFEAWRRAAVARLVFTLPSEIRSSDDGDSVVLKGPRTSPIACGPITPEFTGASFSTLNDACRWVYSVRREAEARFQFLNSQLSMDWREGRTWPEGLMSVLATGLVGAREAYAFHLQDQSKDALKSLGDLRKSLQDEVSRAQSATRDLLSSLWRDLGIAGVVLALKSPTAPQIASAEALRWVTLATAILLIVSLAYTIFANYRFNTLADEGRAEWRTKLYAFLTDTDWERLVDRPIRRGRRTYLFALPVVIVLYVVAATYLVAISEPNWLLWASSMVGTAYDAGAIRLQRGWGKVAHLLQRP